MILIADDIEKGMAAGQLVKGGNKNRIRGCSYDLTIGTIFWENQILKGADTLVVVPPGGVVSILTAEEMHLPDDICATAFAINKMSSEGFLVLNPGHVDPGFKGPLTVKALNIRKVPMPLQAGASIFTVIFQRLPYPTKSFSHNFTSRVERERNFNETIVQTSPRTIFEMMEADRNGPYPGRHEVRSMITRHWSTWVTAIASALTLLLAAVAAYKSVYPTTISQPPVGPPVQSAALAPPPSSSAPQQSASKESAGVSKKQEAQNTHQVPRPKN